MKMKTNEKVIAIAAIVVILAAGMSMGCVDKEVQLQTSNAEFRNIAADAGDDIASQLGDIITAQDKGDFVTAKMRLATLDGSLVEYISIFEEMKVAENTLPCKKALISAFEETRILGVYLGAYLENPISDEYRRYNMQAINATEQIEIAAMLAERL
jgi:hypothetical protein